MYHDLRDIHWWDSLKRDIAEFVYNCSNCQQVKAEHLKMGGLTQMMDVTTWKWESISKDFVVGFPRTQRQYDSIWDIVDRLTKSTILFLLILLTRLNIMQVSTLMRF